MDASDRGKLLNVLADLMERERVYLAVGIGYLLLCANRFSYFNSGNEVRFKPLGGMDPKTIFYCVPIEQLFQ